MIGMQTHRKQLARWPIWLDERKHLVTKFYSVQGACDLSKFTEIISDRQLAERLGSRWAFWIF